MKGTFRMADVAAPLAGLLVSSSEARRRERSLSAEQWRQLVVAIQEAGFWTLPGRVVETVDGASLLEGRRGSDYRVRNAFGLGPNVNELHKLTPVFLKLAEEGSSLP